MCAAFLKQYEYNTRLEVSIRDLELTKQKYNESFSNFLTRFMNKIGLMKNKLAEKDQVRMIVRNVSPNLVERLQMMNPKSFVDLYDDGLQAEEIENEKKKILEVQEGKTTQLRAHNKEVLVKLWRCLLSNNQGGS